MLVSKLYNSITDTREIAYIVGTGPSLRLFPKQFLKHDFRKTIFGLNYAYKYIQCTYNITIHPEVIPKTWYDECQPWIVKKNKEPKPSEPHDLIYWFDNNKNIFDYSYLTSKDDTLYVGRGIQTAALCLAAKMGFKTAILVGCDMCYLGPENNRHHHFNDQPIQLHGLSPEEVYTEYYTNTAIVRYKLKKAYEMETLSMSPFLGLGHHERDYRRLCGEYDLPSITTGEDISKYNREKPDFT